MAEAGGRAACWVLSLSLLAGCAVGGPLQADPAATAAPIPDLSFAASDQSPVAVTRWGPADPDAVILALHGFGDHGQSTFDAAATAWAADGIATYAPDQRGFGRNISRGSWPGADALVADAVGFAAAVRARHPCRPVILLGHSMGGGIALAAADRSDADALVLAAPAIWGGDALNPLHRLAAWMIAAAVPDTRFSGRGVVRIQASDNLDALRALAADPLYLSPPSAREIFGLVRITDRAADAASRTPTPALLLLGEKDQIVPNDTVAEVFARLPGLTSTRRYPEGWHLLFRDLQAPKVWGDVATFALAQPAPACAS